jgi:hypothetical protein
VPGETKKAKRRNEREAFAPSSTSSLPLVVGPGPFALSFRSVPSSAGRGGGESFCVDCDAIRRLFVVVVCFRRGDGFRGGCRLATTSDWIGKGRSSIESSQATVRLPERTTNGGRPTAFSQKIGIVSASIFKSLHACQTQTHNQGPSSPLMRNPQPASPLSSPAGSPAEGPGTVAGRGEATNELLGRQVMTILTMLLLLLLMMMMMMMTTMTTMTTMEPS